MDAATKGPISEKDMCQRAEIGAAKMRLFFTLKMLKKGLNWTKEEEKLQHQKDHKKVVHIRPACQLDKPSF